MSITPPTPAVVMDHVTLRFYRAYLRGTSSHFAITVADLSTPEDWYDMRMKFHRSDVAQYTTIEIRRDS